ncbi:hypothetical protein HDU93_003209 [Gonapodya sp. JEL0774]|nr:hypothetical protein HDU93_003209 [Gonapodya sp. JEL0774]
MIGDSKAKAFITCKALLPVAREVAALCAGKSIKWYLVDGQEGPFEDFEKAIGGKPTTPIKDQSAGSPMLYTSGSTGRPKGVRRFPMPAPPGINPLDIDLCPPLVTLAQMFFGWPTPVILKLPFTVRQKYNVSSLKGIFHAAAPCPIPVKEEMINWWGPIIHEYYGGTELNGFCLLTAKEWLAHKGSVGRAVIGELKICDENGDALPVGSEGQVFFANGPQFEYFNDPQKTAEAKNKHGWTTLGDVGQLDKDGYLYLTDRKSFMIISGGVNIYPQEVENALVLHPAITDAAVIGGPNEDMGEEVIAVVQPQRWEDASQKFADELKEYLRSRVSHVKVPRKIEFMKQLPRHDTGKLYKRIIKDAYWGKAGPEFRGVWFVKKTLKALEQSMRVKASIVAEHRPSPPVVPSGSRTGIAPGSPSKLERMRDNFRNQLESQVRAAALVTPPPSAPHLYMNAYVPSPFYSPANYMGPVDPASSQKYVNVARSAPSGVALQRLPPVIPGSDGGQVPPFGSPYYALSATAPTFGWSPRTAPAQLPNSFLPPIARTSVGGTTSTPLPPPRSRTPSAIMSSEGRLRRFFREVRGTDATVAGPSLAQRYKKYASEGKRADMATDEVDSTRVWDKAEARRTGVSDNDRDRKLRNPQTDRAGVLQLSRRLEDSHVPAPAEPERDQERRRDRNHTIRRSARLSGKASRRENLGRLDRTTSDGNFGGAGRQPVEEYQVVDKREHTFQSKNKKHYEIAEDDVLSQERRRPDIKRRQSQRDDRLSSASNISGQTASFAASGKADNASRPPVLSNLPNSTTHFSEELLNTIRPRAKEKKARATVVGGMAAVEDGNIESEQAEPSRKKVVERKVTENSSSYPLDEETPSAPVRRKVPRTVLAEVEMERSQRTAPFPMEPMNSKTKNTSRPLVRNESSHAAEPSDHINEQHGVRGVKSSSPPKERSATDLTSMVPLPSKTKVPARLRPRAPAGPAPAAKDAEADLDEAIHRAERRRELDRGRKREKPQATKGGDSPASLKPSPPHIRPASPPVPALANSGRPRSPPLPTLAASSPIQPESEVESPPSMSLAACPHCTRTFDSSRLSKHISVCSRTKNKSGARRVFDSKAARTVEGAEEAARAKAKGSGKREQEELEEKMKRRKGRWRAKHGGW